MKRLQEVSTHSTMTRSLAELASHLVDLRIERVVMEATSDYWKPVFYLRTGSSPGWLTRATSGICRGGRRPTCSIPCGCAKSPNGRCCGPVSSRPPRSDGCGT